MIRLCCGVLQALKKAGYDVSYALVDTKLALGVIAYVA